MVASPLKRPELSVYTDAQLWAAWLSTCRISRFHDKCFARHGSHDAMLANQCLAESNHGAMFEAPAAGRRHCSGLE
ncbi:hypothetical protein F66182_1508 [Fusarium sp. NRRL 66182]|nr:hypothetical protein F66182_1508 [Fusarium sp. NRRL 66182]